MELTFMHMVLRPFTEGLTRALRQPKLILLLWLTGLLVAALLTLPATFAIDAVALVLPQGEPDVLNNPSHQTVFWELLIRERAAFGKVFFSLLWILPLVWLWKVAYGVGLYHAFQGEGSGSFREGVARYWTKGLALSWRFVLLSGIVQVALLIFFILLGFAMPNERTLFWLFAVIWPTLALSVYSVIALCHDYGRATLVFNASTPKDAFRLGLHFPFQHGDASKLFLVWFGITLVLGVLPNALELFGGFSGPISSWIGLAATQILLFLRAGAIVAWHGSNMVFYEASQFYTAPLHKDSQ